jgi:molecular chaperone GrpE
MSEEKDEDFDIAHEDLDDSVVAEEAAGESIKKLRARLKESEAKAKEYLDGWQRAQADFANLRKRDEAAKKEFTKFVSEKLISDLLPVLDSFNLALEHGNKELEPVHKQLMQTLKSHGLEEMDPLGETFDPTFHEAIGTKEVAQKDDQKILEVAQKGYILSGKIIRPAKVIIGQNNG